MQALAPAAALRRIDPLAAAFLLLGWLALYLPTWRDFLGGPWASESQGHEPLVLAVSAWLIWRQWPQFSGPDFDAAPRRAGALLGLGLLLYAFGRTQQFVRLELLSQVLVLAALLMAFGGPGALRRCWFALLFLCFIVPLPYGWVLAITGPMKAAVSAVATAVLATFGYPIGRSGVVITIGQYQLLVAEACAGLQTMFTLEALGLLYTNLMAYRSRLRALLMAVLVVPVSFAANVVRVMVLVLVTYHFGDAAGQGFVHGFAGIVLFAVALALLIGLDRLVTALWPVRWAR